MTEGRGDRIVAGGPIMQAAVPIAELVRKRRREQLSFIAWILFDSSVEQTELLYAPTLSW